MANVNDISLHINADGSVAITAINGIRTAVSKMAEDTETFVGKIKKNWLALSASMLAAYATASKAWNLMEQAANYAEQKNQLQSLAGAYNITADSLISDIQRISDNMISMTDIVDTSVGAMTRNLDPAKLKELAIYADAVGDTMRTSAAEGFRTLTEAAVLGREKTIENIVGIIDLNTALGNQINKMSEAEKAQARVNIMLEHLALTYPMAGREVDSFADKMEKLTATVQNLNLHMGTVLIRITLGAVGAFQWLAAGALNAAGGIFELLSAAEWLTDKLGITDKATKKFANMAEAAFLASEDQALKAANNFAAMVVKSEDLVRATNNIKKLGTDGAKPAGNDIAKLNDQIQDLIDKATLSPIALIEKQAEAWRKAGGSELKIKEWVAIEKLKVEMDYRDQIDASNKKLDDDERRRQEERHREVMEFYRQEAEYRVRIYEDSWRQMFDIANQVGGEMGQGLGQMMAGMKGMMDIEIGQDIYSQKLDQLQEFLRQKQALQMEGVISELQLEQYLHQTELQWDSITQQKKLSMTLNTLNIIQGALASFGAFSAKENKAMFLLSKAVGIAIIWVQTQIAAMSAAAAVAGMGPVVAAAAFAQMQLLGHISMAAAAAATIGQMGAGGGGGGATAGISGGGGYEYTSPTQPSWQQEEQEKSQVINVHIYGNVVDEDAFARNLVLSIQKASEDGVH